MRALRRSTVIGIPAPSKALQDDQGLQAQTQNKLDKGGNIPPRAFWFKTLAAAALPASSYCAVTFIAVSPFTTQLTV